MIIAISVVTRTGYNEQIQLDLGARYLRFLLYSDFSCTHWLGTAVFACRQRVDRTEVDVSRFDSFDSRIDSGSIGSRSAVSLPLEFRSSHLAQQTARSSRV